MLRLVCVLFLSLAAWKTYAWNALGHQLVAQIAYDHLTPKAQKKADEYTQGHFILAATWLDSLRKMGNHEFDKLHYIDLPFSKDHSKLPDLQKTHALWGINQAIALLSSTKSNATEKSLSLRMLLHLVGDLHQPLHAATQISKSLPKGDLGGNLFPLGKNPLAHTLHAYWDKGAWSLINRKSSIKTLALEWEKEWPCSLVPGETNPELWAQESHQLALTQVYSIHPHQVPNKKYQLMAQEISKKQIVFAGCRLANLLNDIFAKNS